MLFFSFLNGLIRSNSLPIDSSLFILLVVSFVFYKLFKIEIKRNPFKKVNKTIIYTKVKILAQLTSVCWMHFDQMAFFITAFFVFHLSINFGQYV